MNTELSVKTKSIEQKLVMLSAVRTVCSVAALIIIIVLCVIFVPRIDSTLTNAEKAAADLAKVSSDLSTADLPAAIEGFREFLKDSGELMDSARRITELDIAKLNEAIESFYYIITPMAEFFGK